jgi:hypothetical protein
VGGSDATERSERFVAEVDMLLICVSAEKLRDRLNDDDVFEADSPLWPLFTESPPEWRRGLARECLLACVPGSKSGKAGISASGVSSWSTKNFAASINPPNKGHVSFVSEPSAWMRLYLCARQSVRAGVASMACM